MSQPTITRADWIIILTLSILWGGSFLFIAIALKGFAPMTLVFLRTGLAAAALSIWLRWRGQRIPGGMRNWTAYFVLGALNLVLPFTLFFWGITAIPSGLASILNATTPVWGVIVAHLFTADEKATPTKLAGVALGLGGVAVMIGGDALAGLGDTLLPQLGCVLATLSYALALVYGRRFRGWGVEPMPMAAGHLIAASVLVLPIALIVDRPWALPPHPDAVSIGAVIALALFSTTVAYALYFRLLASAGTVAATLPTFVIPIVAVFLGITILHEQVEPRHWAGMALIAAGLAAIDGRLMRFGARAAARSG